MKIAREGGLLRITLDGPDPRNALSSEDCERLMAALTRDDANAVLIDALGQFFCGGLGTGVDPGSLFEPQTWRRCPVVAAVQGPALNEGVALIACAHVVVAAQGTSFGLTSMRTREFPRRCYAALARSIGERRALEVALTARVFTASDALAWGLIQHVAPAFEFDDRAQAIANALAAATVRLEDVTD